MNSVVKVCNPRIVVGEGVLTTVGKYPSWKKHYLNPAFARPWPRQFNLCEVELWFDSHQASVEVPGYRVYEELNRAKLLRRCLNLYHGLSVKRRGARFFDKFFGGKNLYLWGALLVDKDDGGMDVPFLYKDEEKFLVSIEWRSLDLNWTFKDPAIMFKNER